MLDRIFRPQVMLRLSAIFCFGSALLILISIVYVAGRINGKPAPETYSDLILIIALVVGIYVCRTSFSWIRTLRAQGARFLGPE